MINALLWQSMETAVIAGDVATLEQLIRQHPQLLSEESPPAYVPSGPGPRYEGTDARSIIMREHDFESWTQFAEHSEEVKRKDSPVARFEAAVEAIITGDAAALERLLHAHPELIRARSTRKHHSTLLHYVGANGVEGFRQKTPQNAVQITELLLAAGAEIDAVADMYGGSTTLGLVATSIHPELAGVQLALLETLLKHGATNNGVRDCLANGRGEAAEFLARRGAPLNLEEAAGVGRLDVVESFFDEDGSLKDNATEGQLKSGFGWACGYGRTRVVEFLLQKSMKVTARLPQHGQTGLHSAAYGVHADTVKLLLDHSAPVDALDERFGGTPLGWALYGWGESSAAKRARYHEVVTLLVAAGATVDPAWLDEKDRGMPLDRMLSADPRMRAALRGEMPH